MTFATGVTTICEAMRQRPIAWNTARQLLDSATSMAANYRATARARSRAEWIAKLGVVVEEADEAVYWLEYAIKAGMTSASEATTLLVEAKELRAIFAASYATSRRNRRK